MLLIESHPFFRNLLAPVVTAAGYEVTIAANAEEAKASLAAGQAFDVVLTDADAPQTYPVAGPNVIAISSRTDTEAVPKSDRHALLNAIARAVRQSEMEVGEAA